MRSNFFSFEDLSEGDVSEQIDPNEMIEAQAEAEDTTDEVDAVVSDIETGEEELETVDDVQEVIDDSIESGEGLDEVTVESIRITMRGVMRRLNAPVEYVNTRYSPENFSQESTRLSNTRILSQENEGIGTRIKLAIVKAFKALVDLLATWASKIISWQRVLKRAVKALDDKAAELEKAGAEVKADYKTSYNAAKAYSLTGTKGSFEISDAGKMMDNVVAHGNGINNILKTTLASFKGLSETYASDKKLTSGDVSVVESDDTRVNMAYPGNKKITVSSGSVVSVAGVEYPGISSLEISTTPTGANGNPIDFGNTPDVKVASSDIPALSEIRKYISGVDAVIGSTDDLKKTSGELSKALSAFVKVVDKADVGEDKDAAADLKKNRQAVATVLRRMGTNAANLTNRHSDFALGSVRLGMWYANACLSAYGPKGAKPEEKKEEAEKAD